MVAYRRVEGGKRSLSTVLHREEHILALIADVSDFLSCSVMLYMSQRGRKLQDKSSKKCCRVGLSVALPETIQGSRKQKQRPHDLDFHEH